MNIGDTCTEPSIYTQDLSSATIAVMLRWQQFSSMLEASKTDIGYHKSYHYVIKIA